MLWKIAICDDELVYRNRIYNLCKSKLSTKKLEVTIHQFQSGKDLLASNEFFDIIFLDVEMNCLDGFVTAKELYKLYKLNKKLNKKPYIIYITNHEEWIQRAFEVRAYRYVYKKDIEQVPDIMMDAFQELMDNNGILINVKDENSYQHHIKYSEIYAIESIGDATSIYLENEHLITNTRVKDLLKDLDPRFIECNRGKIVNLQKIKIKKPYLIILRNGIQLKVSRRRDKLVDAEFQSYIIQNSRKG